MKITYDHSADAAYIYVKKAKIRKTVELNDHTIVDLDAENNLVGIELLTASNYVTDLPKTSLKSKISTINI